MKFLFAVYDCCSDTWQDPICARTESEACRAFMISCLDPAVPEQYLRDICLMRLGSFDENTGEVIGAKPVKVLFGDDPFVLNYRKNNFNSVQNGGNSNEISNEAHNES